MAAGHDGGAAAAPFTLIAASTDRSAPWRHVALSRSRAGKPPLEQRANVGERGDRHYLWADKRTRETA
jgi:hypothetical protein